MADKKAARLAHTKELVQFLKSKPEIINSKNLEDAMLAAQNIAKTNETMYIGRSGGNKKPAHFCFIDGNFIKCMHPNCKGFKTSFKWQGKTYTNHVNKAHKRRIKEPLTFTYYNLIAFRMDEDMLCMMDFFQLEKWFAEERERQLNTIPTMLWSEEVYESWSMSVADAVEDMNFKFCANADVFNRKFEDTDQSTKWTSIFVVKDSSGLGGGYPDADRLLELLKTEEGDEEITFIDVHQATFPTAERKQYVELFETPKKERRTVYNNLQMEISHVPALKDSIVLPDFAKEHSMVDELGLGNAPRYERYVLLTHAGAFTDFHVDLGGFSDYFHVLKGTKVFYFVEPTETNLTIFEDYLKNHRSESGLNWFGNRHGVDIKKVTLTTGCTSFMPSGWIHAVYTVEDTIAISGSFFESTCIPMHIRVFELEESLGMDELHRVEEFIPIHKKYLLQKLFKTVQENNDNGTSMSSTTKMEWTWGSFRKLVAFMEKTKWKKKKCITDLQFKSCQEQEKRQLDLQGRNN